MLQELKTLKNWIITSKYASITLTVRNSYDSAMQVCTLHIYIYEFKKYVNNFFAI